MKRNIRIACLLAVMILLLTGLCACSDPNLAVEEYSMIVTEDDISQLDMFPNLKYADLRGSTCYEAIEAYIASHPNVQVRYSIQFGNKRVDITAEELTLNCEYVPFEDVISNLQHLDNLRKVFLSNITYSANQINQLKSTYPHIEFEYSVAIGNDQYRHDATSVNLSQLNISHLEDTLEKLYMLPCLETAELMTPSGVSHFGIKDVKLIQDLFPNVLFHYSFHLFGKTVSTTDETVTYTDITIGNQGEQELRIALDVLDACKTIILDDCGMDDAVIVKLQEDYPHIRFVWRLHFGKYSILTNEEMIRIYSGITDENSKYLMYCTDIKYMDIAENADLSDFSFVSYMPHLKYVIATLTNISDLSPFVSCKELEWLELFGCSRVESIAPLEKLTNLKCLNISRTSIDDLTPIMNLKLQQFVCVGTDVSSSQLREFTESQPNCLSTFTGAYPRVWGWRYIDKNKTYSPYYEDMITIFHYDNPKYTGNKKLT